MLLVIDENKSHYAYIKAFDRFMFHKAKNKNKKYFCKSCLQCFVSKNVLTEYKKLCLSINGAQSVRLEKGTIEFKNYFKQIPLPFKIYADFECNLKSVESYEDDYAYEYMDIFKRFGEGELPDRECFYSSVKDGTTCDNGERLDGHISNKDYLTCKKIWNEFNVKNMDDYRDLYLKKDVLLLADVFEKFSDICLKFY